MKMDADASVLVLVDYQTRLMPAIDGGQSVLARAVRLAKFAQLFKVPLLITEQSADKLGASHPDLAPFAKEVISKEYFDACSDGLIGRLPPDRTQIVIAGCEAHVCLLQTTLGLLAQGFIISIVEDATGSRSEIDRRCALMRLQQAGASLVTSEMVGFEWAGHSNHAAFRGMLALIK